MELQDFSDDSAITLSLSDLYIFFYYSLLIFVLVPTVSFVWHQCEYEQNGFEPHYCKFICDLQTRQQVSKSIECRFEF